MNVTMFTNTYAPHVGGVAGSVSSFEEALRRRGYSVTVVAPEFEGGEESTEFVLRTPAIRHFSGSDFSVRIPQPGLIADFLDRCRPEILHSHHPFLLGDSALRAAWARRLPLVFTHHTLYEEYTHYLPIDSGALKRFVVQMATEYCNLCNHVIAPSQSVADLLVDRGVTSPITPIPTGVDLEHFGKGHGAECRTRYEIADDALVVGHVGRLAEEKNLQFLADAVGRFLAGRPEAVLLVVGAGDSADSLRETVLRHVDERQLRMPGCLTGHQLLDAYAAMDVFAFSSQSETQGMVLAEAMAASTPVVALDGPGVREVVTDENGRLLAGGATADEFAAALSQVTEDTTILDQLRKATRDSIEPFGIEACTDRLVELYESLVDEYAAHGKHETDAWDRFVGRLEAEWNLLSEKTAALAAVINSVDISRNPHKK